MKPAALGLWLAILPAIPAMADGPALAHLTIEGRTLTLTADESLPAPQMLRRGEDRLDLHFAQLHLGFPLPPHLSVSLQQTETDWTLTTLTLDRSEAEPPLAIGPETLRLTHGGEAGAETFVISGEAMAQGGALIPVHIEITLTSP